MKGGGDISFGGDMTIVKHDDSGNLDVMNKLLAPGDKVEELLIRDRNLIEWCCISRVGRSRRYSNCIKN